MLSFLEKNAIGVEISSKLQFLVKQLVEPIMFRFKVKLVGPVIFYFLYMKFCYIKIRFGEQCDKINFSLEQSFYTFLQAFPIHLKKSRHVYVAQKKKKYLQ